MGKGRLSFPGRFRRPNKNNNHNITAAAAAELQPLHPPPATSESVSAAATTTTPAKGAKKKAGGSKLWLRLDGVSGRSELVEFDKSAILRRVSIPARDLRILGPVFSESSNILARDKAIIVNLEFIKAIVTAEEMLLLDPLSQEVLPFVDKLRQQLPLKSPSKSNEPGIEGKEVCSPTVELGEGLQNELPFEFQVLEIALEVVCAYLDSNVLDLERVAYPALDELARNVSNKNLEQVRSLKSNLTRVLARVQKVRDEIEHLLDDDEDMAQLYLTRKQIQNQQFEALYAGGNANSIVPVEPNLLRSSSNINGSASFATSIHSDNNDVEDLEMLLEAYFMQLDATRNKILSVREYIDDTEDYVNIQLDNQRNELIQLQLTLTIASFAIAVDTFIVGAFAMNIPCHLFYVNGIFVPFVGGTSFGCFLIFLFVLGYARWKKLLGS
ncbi:Magnesium transporter MRS2-4 [Acorus calamus]|uniref:Magnesium transporter n=1 Tax=Acorus calamus TaxID=4465 RepID=A0AAV9CJC1_ACOCL|nr:Magnesium transporter MRS2-4 [Acorus calamus]